MALKMKQGAAVTCFMPNLQMFISGISFFFSWDMKCALVHLGGKKIKKGGGVSWEIVYYKPFCGSAQKKSPSRFWVGRRGGGSEGNGYKSVLVGCCVLECSLTERAQSEQLWPTSPSFLRSCFHLFIKQSCSAEFVPWVLPTLFFLMCKQCRRCSESG